MAAPKRRVSLSKRGFKRKRLVWTGAASVVRCHHVDLTRWVYKAKRLDPFIVSAFY
ncbi:hypothetical protein AADW59_00035 [Candidatus Hodgkinia cicadicola]